MGAKPLLGLPLYPCALHLQYSFPLLSILKHCCKILATIRQNKSFHCFRDKLSLYLLFSISWFGTKKTQENISCARDTIPDIDKSLFLMSNHEIWSLAKCIASQQMNNFSASSSTYWEHPFCSCAASPGPALTFVFKVEKWLHESTQ